MAYIFSSEIIIIWARIYIKEILESHTPNYYPWLSWDKGCSHVELWVDFLLHVSILENFHNEYVKCFQSEEKDVNFMKLLEILTVLGSSYIAPTMCQEPFWVLYIYYLVLTTVLWGNYCHYPYFTIEGPEAQRGWLAWLFFLLLIYSLN